MQIKSTLEKQTAVWVEHSHSVKNVTKISENHTIAQMRCMPPLWTNEFTRRFERGSYCTMNPIISSYT